MIVVIGTGAMASELAVFFPNIKGYLEYSSNLDKYYNRYHYDKPVLGDIDSYNIQSDDNFLLAVADIEFRKKMICKIKSRGGRMPNFIHDTATISKIVTMGEGNIIYPFCIVSPNVVLGNYNAMTCQSIVSHDCVLGDNNFLATTLLCGHTKVADDNSFGIRSTSVPHITIGSRNVIQAGMIVNKNLKDDSTVFYRYKEQLIINNK